MRKIIIDYGKYLVVAVISLAIVLFNNSVKKQPLLADDNTEYVKAVVVEVAEENLQAEADSDVGDSQKVTLLIKSGTYKEKLSVHTA